MKKITPTLPKGTRDFGPNEMKKREYLFKIFKDTFSIYGFNALETPSMENINVLNGKYGEEGDKLIFRILDSGEFIKGIDNIESKDSNNLRKVISKKGLRYDLTVPFARYVSMNRDKITLPFKRYQIQNVWRADRPQKGRFREFYQCDVDYIGTRSIVCEAEIIDLVYSIFEKLKIQDFSVKLNNRKVLFGIAETMSLEDNFDKICIIIDKIDKIGKDKFIEELKSIELSKSQIEKLNSVLFFEGTNNDKIKFLKSFLSSSSTGLEGINEIENLTQLSKEFTFDLNLARGLSYYTSSIFEVILDEKNIGSLCGGGRYDDLTEIFGYKDISGIGISFGIERIYEIMKERNLFPDSINKKDTVLVCSMSEKIFG